MGEHRLIGTGFLLGVTICSKADCADGFTTL